MVYKWNNSIKTIVVNKQINFAIFLHAYQAQNSRQIHQTESRSETREFWRVLVFF